MTPPVPHDTWIERVLGLEELAPGPRAETEAHLDTCDSCRMLRARLLAGERAAFATPPLPAPGASALDALSPAERAAERASLQMLLRRVPRARRAWAPSRGAWAGLAAAAALIVAVLLWPGGTTAPLTGVLERESGARGTTADGWHTGDRFRLRVTMPRAGHLVVLHVDDAGAVTRLYPRSAADAARRIEAGPVVLPPADGDAVWAFTGEPGRESFLVVRTSGGEAAAVRVEALAAGAAARGAPRDSILARMRLAIERDLGPVLRLDAEHRR